MSTFYILKKILFHQHTFFCVELNLLRCVDFPFLKYRIAFLDQSSQSLTSWVSWIFLSHILCFQSQVNHKHTSILWLCLILFLTHTHHTRSCISWSPKIHHKSIYSLVPNSKCMFQAVNCFVQSIHRKSLSLILNPSGWVTNTSSSIGSFKNFDLKYR